MLIDILRHDRELHRQASLAGQPDLHGEIDARRQEWFAANPAPVDEVIELLREIKRNPEWELSYPVLSAAWSNLCAEYNPPLCDLILDENCRGVHEWCLNMLSKMPGPECVPACTKAIHYRWGDDPGLNVPRIALDVLARVATPQAITVIWRAATESDELLVRQFAFEELALLDTSASFELETRELTAERKAARAQQRIMTLLDFSFTGYAKHGLPDVPEFIAEPPDTVQSLRTFDPKVEAPLSPMLKARFGQFGSCRCGADRWFSESEMISAHADRIVQAMYQSRRVDFMVPDDHVGLFGWTEGTPRDAIYLVWTLAATEPELWFYRGSDCKKFRHLEKFLLWNLTRELYVYRLEPA